MNIKGRMASYFMISIVFPIAIYLASIFGNDMLKELASISFILIAIIILFLSVGIIEYVFKDRGHENIDKDFVIRMNLAIILMFLVRYVAVNLMKVTDIPLFLVNMAVMPFMFLIIIPFIRNYCINRKTIKMVLFTSFILIYLIIPLLLFLINKIDGESIVVLKAVYEKYFIYESTANQWLMYILELIKVDLPDAMILILINVTKFAMWSIVFLPYFVINFVLIDELSYMELCIELPKRKIAMAFVVLILCVVACISMSNKGQIELMYDLKHY